jgi:hypothetical protein
MIRICGKHGIEEWDVPESISLNETYMGTLKKQVPPCNGCIMLPDIGSKSGIHTWCPISRSIAMMQDQVADHTIIQKRGFGFLPLCHSDVFIIEYELPDVDYRIKYKLRDSRVVKEDDILSKVIQFTNKHRRKHQLDDFPYPKYFGWDADEKTAFCKFG